MTIKKLSRGRWYCADCNTAFTPPVPGDAHCPECGQAAMVPAQHRNRGKDGVPQRKHLGLLLTAVTIGIVAVAAAAIYSQLCPVTVCEKVPKALMGTWTKDGRSRNNWLHIHFSHPRPWEEDTMGMGTFTTSWAYTSTHYKYKKRSIVAVKQRGSRTYEVRFKDGQTDVFKLVKRKNHVGWKETKLARWHKGKPFTRWYYSED
jgi:hypothetical protein